MKKADIGLIGLAIMGQNLVLNLERNGFTVAVYNRTKNKTRDFIKIKGEGKKIIGCFDLEEFSERLTKPRKILLMIQAGKAVDSLIKELTEILEPKDIIIDGGNSHFKDTIRRSKMLKAKRLQYLGTGISGGEEGALKGPSIMPGGSKEAWKEVKVIFQKIAAKINGNPCCDYIGPNGAGHYVKMVHNGIEYSDMQLIAESYFILKNFLNLNANDLKNIFTYWNDGDLNSYLIEITKNIFGTRDPETGKPIVDIILDSADQKGTGKWTSQEALEVGASIPSITEAVFFRIISARKEERVKASNLLRGPKIKFLGKKDQLVEATRNALYAAKLCSYAQGFSLLKAASKEYNWKLDLGNIALMWRGGCIIRAQFLERIKTAYDRNKDLENLLIDPYFSKTIEKNQEDWRYIVGLAVKNGIPIPGFSSALAYYDSYRISSLPTNLIQAQRDYFGAHGFERVDKERGMRFHCKSWLKNVD
ncbi:MAG: decarboxylating NADP(+)-dependent phosphogluconate dehydrogenase [Candidatus Hodarchaeota archaeon]